MDMSLNKLWVLVVDREAWHAAVYGVSKGWTWLSNWTELNWTLFHDCAGSPLAIQQVSLFIRGYLWSFCSIPLIYILIFAPIPWCPVLEFPRSLDTASPLSPPPLSSSSSRIPWLYLSAFAFLHKFHKKRGKKTIDISTRGMLHYRTILGRI